jgi:N-methylhydantoinase A
MAVIIGVDIGGTFTDVVALDTSTGALRSSKALTAYGDEGQGVLTCLSDLGIAPEALERLAHGTTIGTNAILERRGAKTALLATQGFRDLLEIGRTRRMAPNTLFDLTFRRPDPLVPRALRFDVKERLLSSGEVLEPLDLVDLRRTLGALAEAGVESVAICYLHSYAEPAHERATREEAARLLPQASVSLSHEVIPEYREFERMSTTVLNAYIAPLLEHYLDKLSGKLAGIGARARIFVMSSNGGTMSIERAKRFPAQTVLSGPAGGVVAGVMVGERTSIRHLITYDMGGTSTDVSMVRDLRPRLTVDNVITGLPIKVPQVDINTVGSGGGSVAWVSEEGQLRVGPRSAGSRPGPICYGRGGTEITVTDANLVLGRLALRRKLGGKIAPSDALVRPAMQAMAKRLGIADEYRMADGIVRIAVAKMVSSIREISVARGYDPRECALVAFGGAGPMHATQIAADMGIPRVVVPPFAGAFSALGLVASDIRHDLVETVLVHVADKAMAKVAHAHARIEAQGRARLADDGFEGCEVVIERSLDMRYKGQAFELNIPVPAAVPDAATLRSDFNRAYAQAYGHANEDDEIEIVNARLAAAIRIAKPELRGPEAPGEPMIERRTVWFAERTDAVPILDRERLPRGQRYDGPLVVEEIGATTVVFPGWSMERDGHDNLVIERRK